MPPKFLVKMTERNFWDEFIRLIEDKRDALVGEDRDFYITRIEKLLTKKISYIRLGGSLGYDFYLVWDTDSLKFYYAGTHDQEVKDYVEQATEDLKRFLNDYNYHLCTKYNIEKIGGQGSMWQSVKNFFSTGWKYLVAAAVFIVGVAGTIAAAIWKSKQDDQERQDALNKVRDAQKEDKELKEKIDTYLENNGPAEKV